LEACRRLLDLGGPASFAAMCSLSDINFNVDDIAADGVLITSAAAGIVRLEQVRLHSFNASTPTPSIVLNSPSPQVLTADGLAVGGGEFSPSSAASMFVLSTGNHAVVRGFVDIAADGSVASITDYDSRG
jgi:hypothetical protein